MNKEQLKETIKVAETLKVFNQKELKGNYYSKFVYLAIKKLYQNKGVIVFRENDVEHLKLITPFTEDAINSIIEQVQTYSINGSKSKKKKLQEQLQNDSPIIIHLRTKYNKPVKVQQCEDLIDYIKFLEGAYVKLKTKPIPVKMDVAADREEPLPLANPNIDSIIDYLVSNGYKGKIIKKNLNHSTKYQF
jgi:hypothetical protein